MSLFSATRVVRTRAEKERFKKVVETKVNALTDWPNRPVRVSTRLAKYILLNYETLIARGVTYSTQVRNVGAGVKELYLKEMEQ